MARVKQFGYQFCISTTGSLVGMILTVQLINASTTIRVIDLWGLLLANFLIILLVQMIYGAESHSRLSNGIRIGLHYIGTLAILFTIAYKLQWLEIDKGKNILPFGGIISIIYLLAAIMITISGYHTSNEINEALNRYKNRKIK